AAIREVCPAPARARCLGAGRSRPCVSSAHRRVVFPCGGSAGASPRRREVPAVRPAAERSLLLRAARPGRRGAFPWRGGGQPPGGGRGGCRGGGGPRRGRTEVRGGCRLLRPASPSGRHQGATNAPTQPSPTRGGRTARGGDRTV